MLPNNVIFSIALIAPLFLLVVLFFLGTKEHVETINLRLFIDRFTKVSIEEPDESSLLKFVNNISNIGHEIRNVRNPKIRLLAQLYKELVISLSNEKYLSLYRQNKKYANTLKSKLNSINSAFLGGNIDEIKRLLTDTYGYFYYYEMSTGKPEHNQDEIFYETISSAAKLLQECSPLIAGTKLSQGLQFFTQNRTENSNTGLQIVILVSLLRCIQRKEPNWDMEKQAVLFKRIAQKYKRGDMNGVYYHLEKFV